VAVDRAKADLSIGDQAISDARLGLKVLRPGRIGFELSAELCNVGAQILGLVELVWAPDLVQQLTVRLHRSRQSAAQRPSHPRREKRP
jgi:hypothetical protein